MFAHHPFVTSGIFSISSFFLNASLFATWRRYLEELVAGDSKVKVAVIFGTEDKVVPNLATLSNVQLCPLEKLGHESLDEDTSAISPHVIELLERAD